jgi:hypothetical protein
VADGGRREDALQDAGEHAIRDVPAVTFEVELSFERVVDRLDDLARRPGPLAGTLGFAPAGQGSGSVLNAPPMTSIVTTGNADTNVSTSGSRVTASGQRKRVVPLQCSSPSSNQLLPESARLRPARARVAQQGIPKIGT